MTETTTDQPTQQAPPAPAAAPTPPPPPPTTDQARRLELARRAAEKNDRQTKLVAWRDQVKRDGEKVREWVTGNPECHTILLDFMVQHHLLNPDETHENENNGLAIASHRYNYYLTAQRYLAQRRTIFGMAFVFCMMPESPFNEVLHQLMADMISARVAKVNPLYKPNFNTSAGLTQALWQNNNPLLEEFKKRMRQVALDFEQIFYEIPSLSRGPGVRRLNYMDKAGKQVEAITEAVGVLEAIAFDVKTAAETCATSGNNVAAVGGGLKAALLRLESALNEIDILARGNRDALAALGANLEKTAASVEAIRYNFTQELAMLESRIVERVFRSIGVPIATPPVPWAPADVKEAPLVEPKGNGQFFS